MAKVRVLIHKNCFHIAEYTSQQKFVSAKRKPVKREINSRLIFTPEGIPQLLLIFQ